MAKTNTPFFGLGSHGSIGNTITTQKRHGTTMVRAKPTPAYRRTLPQQYQRWLYEDYSYLWTQQSAATRAEYRTAGSRFHLTGFQYWMKVMLLTLPDILGWWKLDEKAGAIAHDSGRNLNHGVITGASPSTLAIDGAHHFDGLNDRIDVPAPLSLQNLTQKSLVFFFKHSGFTGTSGTITYHGYAPAPYGERVFAGEATNNIQIWMKNNAGIVGATAANFTPDIIHCFIYTWDGTTLTAYIDAETSYAPAAFTGTLACIANLRFGATSVPDEWYPGDLDNLIYYNRCLDLTEVRRWTQRRYPS